MYNVGNKQRQLNALRFSTPLFARLAKASVFRGTMMFPLAGSETAEEFDRDTVFTGDMKYPNVRREIFSRPRRYSFSIILVPASGWVGDVDIGEYDLPDDGGVTQGELVQLIKQYAQVQLFEKDTTFYDLERSVVIIQLFHTKEELDYERIITSRISCEGTGD